MHNAIANVTFLGSISIRLMWFSLQCPIRVRKLHLQQCPVQVLQKLGGVCPRDGQNAFGREALQELRRPPAHLRPRPSQWRKTPGAVARPPGGPPPPPDPADADLAVNRNSTLCRVWSLWVWVWLCGYGFRNWRWMHSEESMAALGLQLWDCAYHIGVVVSFILKHLYQLKGFQWLVDILELTPQNWDGLLELKVSHFFLCACMRLSVLVRIWVSASFLGCPIENAKHLVPSPGFFGQNLRNPAWVPVISMCLWVFRCRLGVWVMGCHGRVTGSESGTGLSL